MIGALGNGQGEPVPSEAAAQAAAAHCRQRFEPTVTLARMSVPPLEQSLARAAGSGPDHLLGLARLFYQLRRRRGQFFGETLFAEPGWDILLDLYIAGREGRNVCVSGACTGAFVPATTALRWLKMVEDAGLVVRRSDRRDGRRVYVELSNSARFRMDTLLHDAALLIGREL